MNKIYRDIDWSTEGIEASQQVSAWRDMLSQDLVELEVVSRSTDFGAGWKRFDLGNVDFDVLHSKPQTIRHSSEMVAKSSDTNYLIVYFQRQIAEIEHGNSCFLAPQGSITLIDNSKPYSIDFPQGSVCLSLRANEKWLDRWLPHPHLSVGSVIDGSRPWAVPALACFRALAMEGPEGAAFGRESIADQIGALLANAFALHFEPSDTCHRLELFRRARSKVEEMCAVPGLTVADIAVEMGISERYLHQIFADRGATVGAYITEARLQYARTMLRSQQFRALSISTIAFRAGFLDRRHFSRRFRERFGEAPSEARPG